MIPTQKLTVPFPVTLSIKKQGDRYQLNANDQVFNYYENEELNLTSTKKTLTIGVK